MQASNLGIPDITSMCAKLVRAKNMTTHTTHNQTPPLNSFYHSGLNNNSLEQMLAGLRTRPNHCRLPSCWRSLATLCPLSATNAAACRKPASICDDCPNIATGTYNFTTRTTRINMHTRTCITAMLPIAKPSPMRSPNPEPKRTQRIATWQSQPKRHAWRRECVGPSPTTNANLHVSTMDMPTPLGNAPRRRSAPLQAAPMAAASQRNESDLDRAHQAHHGY